MKSRLILLLLASCAGTAFAQYKCTAANGAITFQQTPCFGAKSEEKLTVIPNGHPPARPASAASGASAVAAAAPPVATPPKANVDKLMLAKYERQRQRDTLLQAVQSAQDDKAARVQQRQADIANARKQFGDDPGNAALLRDALVEIDKRYDALTQLDESRIREAQAALANWDKAPALPVK
ncbi:DUF4124 domain-containing protein [Scleromatobacter humisilvae]|uniref:DUF4124 domain-containing protein n=1 Tax=Scleromatobacter humisilvae TaxID=2897159 RepID=A0A9X2C1P4_9BURK|nr:DUF4124 domain-containing protein [Scleromatobacter humisilvae]MCK9685984.1 DUF4124 domain-containing protein [Scleromatobacter humisilvae]